MKSKMPFLAGGSRLAVRAVKGAGCAFTGAKRTPLTEEADGLGARFPQEGHDAKTGKDFRSALRTSVLLQGSPNGGDQQGWFLRAMRKPAESVGGGWAFGCGSNDLHCGALDNFQTLCEQRCITVPKGDVVGARGSRLKPDGIRHDVGDGLGFGFALALGRTDASVAAVHQFVRDFVGERLDGFGGGLPRENRDFSAGRRAARRRDVGRIFESDSFLLDEPFE